MNLIERAKNIIIKPKDEWDVISQENTSVNQLVTGYLLILALIPAGAVFIKFGLIGTRIAFLGHVSMSLTFGIGQAVVTYITSVGGAILSAVVIDALAPSFGSQKNMVKAMQLVIFSYTPMMLAGIFQIIPRLSILGLAGLYGLYLLYLGLTPMMQTPEDKKVGYLVVSILITIVIYVILGAVLGGILSVFVSTGYGLSGI